MLPVRAPNLKDLTLRLNSLDDHGEDDWSWMDPMGEDVPNWAYRLLDPRKQADNEKKFFGGRLIAALKRMRDLELDILRVRAVEDQRWVNAVCRELGIEVEVQTSYTGPDGPDRTLYKPAELDGEVEGFHLEGVNIEEDVEYETGWEHYC